MESVCKGIRNTIGNYYWAYHGEKPLFNTDKRTRAIYQIDLATNTIVNKYNSAQEASKLLSISDANISQVCKCKRNSCGGYGWQYAEI